MVSGSETVWITSGGGGWKTIMKSGFVLEVPSESFNRTTNEVEPTVVDRPEITPLPFIVRPSGNAPESMLQVYGPTPPDASSAALY